MKSARLAPSKSAIAATRFAAQADVASAESSVRGRHPVAGARLSAINVDVLSPAEKRDRARPSGLLILRQLKHAISSSLSSESSRSSSNPGSAKSPLSEQDSPQQQYSSDDMVVPHSPTVRRPAYRVLPPLNIQEEVTADEALTPVEISPADLNSDSSDSDSEPVSPELDYSSSDDEKEKADHERNNLVKEISAYLKKICEANGGMAAAKQIVIPEDIMDAVNADKQIRKIKDQVSLGLMEESVALRVINSLKEKKKVLEKFPPHPYFYSDNGEESESIKVYLRRLAKNTVADNSMLKEMLVLLKRCCPMKDINYRNVHRLILTSLLLVIKIKDDYQQDLMGFVAKQDGQVSKQELNALEKIFFSKIGGRAYITSEDLRDVYVDEKAAEDTFLPKLAI